MTGDRHSDQDVPGGEIVLYQTEDGQVRIECRFEDETIWLTQNLMAELYQTTKQNISLHVRNICKEGELAPEATVKEHLTVRREGSWSVQRHLDYEHIKNIFAEGELSEDSVIRKFRITASDGKGYETRHYSLDAILAVGYRVRSARGTQFRQWATACEAQAEQQAIRELEDTAGKLAKTAKKRGRDREPPQPQN